MASIVLGRNFCPKFRSLSIAIGFQRSSPRQLCHTLLCSLRTPAKSCRQVTLLGRQMSTSPDSPTDKDAKTPVSPVPQYIHVDGFVPLTRRSIVRHLMQQPNWLTEGEIQQYQTFAIALDSAIVGRYHDILQELKSLFDPINPDKDTMKTREWNRRDRLDNEFWLLQQLAGVMEKANFHEVPQAVITRSLAEHSSHNVIVSVNIDSYDVLRFWVLGKESPKETPSLFTRAKYMVKRQPVPASNEFYKRVVVAVRPKSQDKLLLKAFKEVPVNSLELLLPDGKIRMKSLDKNIMLASGGLTGLGLLAKAVTQMAHMTVNWTIGLAAFTGIVGLNVWTTYKNRRNAYFLEMSRMLYFKNIANNRGLLALLVDRAEDELFKEALLVYTFLLKNRPPSSLDKPSEDQTQDDIGALSQTVVELRIREWVEEKTGTAITFDASESVLLLQQLGLLSKDMEELLHVVPLHAAIGLLPQRPQTLAARTEESDMVEGYDRQPELEKEEDYKRINSLLKKYFTWK